MAGHSGENPAISVLLLVEEIPKQPPGMYKNFVNCGINYQPQLVSRDFFHQQYEDLECECPRHACCWTNCFLVSCLSSLVKGEFAKRPKKPIGDSIWGFPGNYMLDCWREQLQYTFGLFFQLT